MTVAVGIDLGTSNSAVAIIERSGRARIFTTPDGSTTMPSLVWFADGGPRVGEAALLARLAEAEETLRAIHNGEVDALEKIGGRAPGRWRAEKTG